MDGLFALVRVVACVKVVSVVVVLGAGLLAAAPASAANCRSSVCRVSLSLPDGRTRTWRSPEQFRETITVRVRYRGRGLRFQQAGDCGGWWSAGMLAIRLQTCGSPAHIHLKLYNSGPRTRVLVSYTGT